ncbi:MAG: 4-hydroxy-tetrahydrodipicolinate reductase [Ginsengibacter sp.]
MKIALIGYGKMGKAIEQIALSKGHEIVLKVDFDNLSDLNPENLNKADVAIEFTGPDSAVGNLFKCFEAKIPVVCGSTGWLGNLDEVKAKCIEYNSTLLYSSNFSIGVNMFFELNQRLAEMMNQHSDYEIKVEETHHTQKKDAPSGTAITIAEGILYNISRKDKWVNAQTSKSNELEILSYRVDPAPGTHKVSYLSPVDDIEIIHTAHNRTGFASGAVLGAEFIASRKGIFCMKDVLGF